MCEQFVQWSGVELLPARSQDQHLDYHAATNVVTNFYYFLNKILGILLSAVPVLLLPEIFRRFTFEKHFMQ